MTTDAEFWDKIFSEGQKYRPLKDEELDAIIAHTGMPKTAADIGAGTGNLVLALAARGIRTTAFDISNVALQKILQTANERGVTEHITTVQADLNDPIFGQDHERAFDLVFMKLAVAFAEKREQVLHRIKEMLHAKGFLIIITPVLLENGDYDERQARISVPRAEFEHELHNLFSDVQVFSEGGEDPHWPLVTYICRNA